MAAKETAKPGRRRPRSLARIGSGISLGRNYQLSRVLTRGQKHRQMIGLGACLPVRQDDPKRGRMGQAPEPFRQAQGPERVEGLVERQAIPPSATPFARPTEDRSRAPGRP
jgi:hypothetical protein